jgi:peptidoglycan hydrolase CwlO-like protein
MKQHKYRKSLQLLCSLLLLLTLSISLPSPVAKANIFSDIYNGFKSFSELPNEVNELKEGFQQTAEELQQAKDKLLDTKQEMEAYQAQNEALQEQNRQLTQMVNELKNDRLARENYYYKIKMIILTGVGLILGYFILIRLIRFSMLHRSRKGDRLR